MKPRIQFQQQITVLTNKYEISEADSNTPLAFAEQAKMKIREKISFYRDSQKTELLFTFRAEKVMDIHGNYFIEDQNGILIGSFRKDFGRSLFSSTWLVSDASGNLVFTFAEENAALAVLRRISDFIPFVGELIKFFPYHFAITAGSSSQKVGRFAKTAVVRDRYLMSLEDEAWEKLDARVFMAIGVGLDALQSR
ncbi:MAG: hypothetical protein RL038_1163 [Actinomycetota bacterium]